MGYRDYSTAKGHIVDATGHGDFTTIQAAITAASSGQTIFIRPGTYTENLTLKAGVNLVSYEPTIIFGTSGTSPSNVIILGKCSFSSAGTVGITDITLKTNSDFCLSVTGTVASIVTLTNCYLQCSNSTGIQLSSTSASSGINLNYCGGSLDTTGIAIFAHSGAGLLWFVHTQFNNAGTSLTANTVSGTGSFHSDYSEMFNPLTVSSSSSSQLFYSNITGESNTTAITSSGTATVQIIYGFVASGSATAISIGTGSTVELHNCFINSSNAVSITGAGILNYTNINGNSVLFPNASTMNPLPTFGGGWSRISTLTASNSTSLDFTTIPIYSVYCMVLNNIRPVTNATQLLLRVSNNNGSTFAATGYTAGINYTSYNSATVTNVNATTSAPLTSNQSNGTGASGTIYFSTANADFWGQSVYLSTDSGVAAFGNVGGILAVQPNAFRLLSSSGNLTSGAATLYGLNT